MKEQKEEEDAATRAALEGGEIKQEHTRSFQADAIRQANVEEVEQQEETREAQARQMAEEEERAHKKLAEETGKWQGDQRGFQSEAMRDAHTNIIQEEEERERQR